MKKSSKSLAERQVIQKNLEEKIHSEKQRRKMMNYKFRRSKVFILSWIMRIIYIFSFVVVAVLYTKPGSSRKEILKNKNFEAFEAFSKSGIHEITNFEIVTNQGNYSMLIDSNEPPPLSTGDTLIIERNYFGKAIFFKERSWAIKFELTANFVFYYILLFLTLLSLFFNDGMDAFTPKILWSLFCLDAFAMVLFFLI